MEYKKIINLLDNTSYQTSKFKTKTWVEKIMKHKEHITKTIKLGLKLKC